MLDEIRLSADVLCNAESPVLSLLYRLFIAMVVCAGAASFHVHKVRLLGYAPYFVCSGFL